MAAFLVTKFKRADVSRNGKAVRLIFETDGPDVMLEMSSPTLSTLLPFGIRAEAEAKARAGRSSAIVAFQPERFEIGQSGQTGSRED